MEINVNINPPKGTEQGSLGWLKSQLENAEVYFSNLQYDNLICIAAKFPHHKNTTHKSRVIAVFSMGRYEDVYWSERMDVGEGTIYATYTTAGELSERPGIFSFPLTKAADKALNEFIDGVVEKLAEYIENQ